MKLTFRFSTNSSHVGRLRKCCSAVTLSVQRYENNFRKRELYATLSSMVSVQFAIFYGLNTCDLHNSAVDGVVLFGMWENYDLFI